MRGAFLSLALSLATPALGADASFAERLGCGDAAYADASYPLPIARAAHDRGALRILIIGSSSTAGTGAGGVGQAYPALTETLLKDALEIDATVIARGKGGERAAGAFARLPKAIKDTTPDLVVWQVGTNDAMARLDPEDVAATIRDGLTVIRAASADAILVDPQFFPRIAGKQTYAEVANIVDRIGERQGVAVVDRFERMRTQTPVDLDALLARDKLHMSRDGHACLARDLTAVILRSVQQD